MAARRAARTPNSFSRWQTARMPPFSAGHDSLKLLLQDLVRQALVQLQDSKIINGELPDTIHIERTRDSKHGDFACNVAMALAKKAGKPPRELAALLINALPASGAVSSVEIAGPGFINFFLSADTSLEVVRNIHEQGADYGRCSIGAGQRIQVEFVSANPTGPLHIGHGRGAAYGATVADLLQACGYEVYREYYVNDAGRQMDILAASVWIRYLQHRGSQMALPDNAYRGDYVKDIATTLHLDRGDDLIVEDQRVVDGIDLSADADSVIDALIDRARELLGETDFMYVHGLGLKHILEGIKKDLSDFGVDYQNWFSERSLADDGSIEHALEVLRNNNMLYVKDGATWFRSTELGDEKDRVVIRDNGQKTYFASDIAYHLNKLERGFEQMIDIWGADHHGYVPRVRAAITAMGKPAEALEVLLVQFAALYRGTEKVQMSTRSGEFVTLRELYDEVGVDAARFFYVLRKCEQHLDFDLELAKSESSDNPVYYVQYAHARICSVLRQLEEKNLSFDLEQGLASLALLSESHEQKLLTSLARYPELLENAGRQREPHQIAHYLRELANDLHTYYNAHQFLVDDAALRNARLSLITATRQVLGNALQLLGVSAPESM